MGIFLDAAYCATLLPHYLYHRVITGKYGPAAPEKLGLPSQFQGMAAEAAPILWIHAVSVGETLAARGLVKAFREACPGWRVRISTTTATGRAVAGKHFGAENVFYYPLDLTWMVRRSFEKISPSLVILMELEIWPQFLAEAERRGIPVVVSNVRITEKSARGFRRLGGFGRKVLGRVSLWLAQDEAYAQRLRALGVKPEKIRVVGSLKYDGLDLSEKPLAAKRLHEELGGGRLLIAGSTHAGEDEVVYQAFVRLRQEFGKDLRLVLAPRHPERCAAVAKLAPAGYSIWRRSQGAPPKDTDIILVDTMGELADIYRAAEVVFIGGTLCAKVGGHNLLEPAAFAKPVVYGPQVHNFIKPAETLENAGGAMRLAESSAEALAAAVAPLLRSPESAAEMGRKGRAAVKKMQGAAARSVELLREYCITA